MADFGVFAKFARTRLCGHLWTRGLRQNVLRWLHFKRILLRRSPYLRRSVFGAAKIGALFNDFPLVAPLKNFRKWPILVSLPNLPELGFAGTFGPAVCVKMFFDDCFLNIYKLGDCQFSDQVFLEPPSLAHFLTIFPWSPLWRISENGRFWCLC